MKKAEPLLTLLLHFDNLNGRVDRALSLFGDLLGNYRYQWISTGF
jgi:hypothetical protein